VQGHKDGVLINATQKKSALWRPLKGIASRKTPVSQDKKADNGSETELAYLGHCHPTMDRISQISAP
jgi:hypothetical protein